MRVLKRELVIPSIPIENLKFDPLGIVVGKGSTANIFKGEYEGFEVAVKKFLDTQPSEKQVEKMKEEARLHVEFSTKCPWVVKCYGIHMKIPNFIIVYELMKGNLLEMLVEKRKENNVGLFWKSLLPILKDICS